MIYFPLFANLNALGREQVSNVQAQAPIWQSFVAGLAAGSVAAVAVTPLDGEWRTDLQPHTPGATFLSGQVEKRLRDPPASHFQ